MAIDDDDDEVSVEVNTDSIYQFASWDSSSMALSLDATDSVESGLYRATVTLDDGELTTEYTLSILILALEEPEPLEPDPPETDPTESEDDQKDLETDEDDELYGSTVDTSNNNTISGSATAIDNRTELTLDVNETTGSRAIVDN